MNNEFKVIRVNPLNTDKCSFNEYDNQYYKVNKSFVIPDNRIILLAPIYMRNKFTLNFYKVCEVYDYNGVDGMIVNGKDIDVFVKQAKEPLMIANINIDFYINYCKEKERLYSIEKELKKAAKDISFYMQMKTLSEMNPDKYGPLVEEWKSLAFKNNDKLLDIKSTDNN